MTRRKPTGWRGESYRHYLAAKGIRSRVSHRYFQMPGDAPDDESKGNRREKSSGKLHALYAKSWSEEQILANPHLFDPDVVQEVKDKQKVRRGILSPADVGVSPGFTSPGFTQTEELQSTPFIPQDRVAIGESAMMEEQAVAAADPELESLGTVEGEVEEEQEQLPVSFETAELPEVSISTPGVPPQSEQFDIRGGL